MVKLKKSKSAQEVDKVDKLDKAAKKKAADGPALTLPAAAFGKEREGTQASASLEEASEEKDPRSVRFRKRISMCEPDEEGSHKPTKDDSADVPSCLREASPKSSASDSPKSRRSGRARSPSPTASGGRRRGGRKETVSADTGATEELGVDAVEQQAQHASASSDDAIDGGGGGTGSSLTPDLVHPSPSLERTVSEEEAQGSVAPKEKHPKKGVRVGHESGAELVSKGPKLVMPCCSCGDQELGLLPSWLLALLPLRSE